MYITSLKDAVKSNVKISTYLSDMGVKVRGGRTVASWRGGKHSNVAIYDESGRWCDFKTNEKGDIFALFSKIEGGDFTYALRTLADRYNILQTDEPSASRIPARKCRPAEPPAEPLSQEERDFVPVTLRGYCEAIGASTAELIGAVVRSSDDALRLNDAAYRIQAARQIRQMFKVGDKVWTGWIIKDEETRKRLGFLRAKTPLQPIKGDDVFDPAVRAGIIEAHTLAERIENGSVAKIPTHISLNPVTGSADNGGSYDSASTIAAYRHLLVEFDDLCDIDEHGTKTPSQEHIDIIAGLMDYAADHSEKMRVVCATYTGKKSLHVCLDVDAKDLDAFKERTNALQDILISADDKAYRADPNGWDNGYNHIRLAGAVRPETGKRARLLSPFVSRPCSDIASNMCGACERFSVCGFRNPRAVRGTTILKK